MNPLHYSYTEYQRALLPFGWRLSSSQESVPTVTVRASPGYISLKWMSFAGPSFPFHRCGADWEVYVQCYKCELWPHSSSTFLSSILNSVVSKWLPTSVLLPGESHGQRSLVGYSPWGHKESDMMKRLSTIEKWSRSIVSDSLQPQGLWPARLLHPWDSPGRNTGVAAIKKNTFESVLMRWMKLEPIIQSEVSQKEKHQYSILTHIYGI